MPTVNEDFKRELRQLFLNGLEEALSADSAGWGVREKNGDQQLDHEEFFLLTISSQLFRVIVVLHFTKNTNLEHYVMDSLKIANKVLEDYKFYDYLGEVGNAFCGAIKRELGKTVPTLGMSTPNRLGRDCLKFVRNQQHEFEAHAQATLHDSDLMFASIFLCADQNLNFDVKRLISTEDEVGSGELEFF